jgi:hypothetical protein
VPLTPAKGRGSMAVAQLMMREQSGGFAANERDLLDLQTA